MINTISHHIFNLQVGIINNWSCILYYILKLRYIIINFSLYTRKTIGKIYFLNKLNHLQIIIYKYIKRGQCKWILQNIFIILHTFWRKIHKCWPKFCTKSYMLYMYTYMYIHIRYLFSLSQNFVIQKKHMYQIDCKC